MSAWRVTPGAGPHEVTTEHDPPWPPSVRQAWGVVGIGDTGGVVQWLSPSVEDVLGYRADELVGSCGLDSVHPDDRDQVEGVYTSLRALGDTSPPIIARCRHRDGTWRRLEIVFTNQLDQPAVAGVVVNARDVTNQVDPDPADPALFRHVADERARHDLDDRRRWSGRVLQPALVRLHRPG